MKTFRIICLLFICFISCKAYAATTPLFTEPVPAEKTIDISRLKPKMIEKLTGKKMKLMEKLRFTILQKKLAKLKPKGKITGKQEDQATTSMILGIASLVLLFIPIISVIAIPAAILAIVFGAMSLKGNSNAKGIIGIVTGGVTLLLLVIAIIIIAAAFSGFRFE